MNFLILYGIGFASFVVGTIGFAQIIGSLRTKQRYFVIPIVIWSILLYLFYCLISIFSPSKINALYGGYLISFFILISQNRIE